LVNAFSGFADAPTPATPLKIVSISFNGNRTTQESTLRMYLANLGIDSGKTFDSIKIVEAKRKLVMTNLFYKVDFIPLAQEDGIHLYVILKELFYYSPSGTIDYFQTTDGRDSWLRLSLGMTKQNFRGRMETLSLRVSGWRDRSLCLSWSKPLLPSTYYFGVSAGAEFYPELNYPRTRLVANSRVLFGKDLSLHSKAYISITPAYTRIDTLCASENLVKDIEEADAAIGFSIDYRNNNFDPISGWFFLNEIMTNGIYSNEVNKYGQYSTDFRLYLPGFFDRNHIACRLIGCFRSNDAGPYMRLYAGGQGSVRGFPSDYLGMSGEMNNSLVFSSEYRFPIVTIPEIGMLSDLSMIERFPELKGMYYQIDGAFIADAGHLWGQFTQPLQIRQNGAGIGGGIKILTPTLRRGLCFDLVWPITKDPVLCKTAIYAPNYYIYLDAYY